MACSIPKLIRPSAITKAVTSMKTALATRNNCSLSGLERDQSIPKKTPTTTTAATVAQSCAKEGHSEPVGVAGSQLKASRARANFPTAIGCRKLSSGFAVLPGEWKPHRNAPVATEPAAAIKYFVRAGIRSTKLRSKRSGQRKMPLATLVSASTAHAREIASCQEHHGARAPDAARSECTMRAPIETQAARGKVT